ncbi:MAG TPA: DUF3293 domain-containing protein [Gemmatales bacterium]|nr:DUF3293 domain-containing protein [Gemmatales bacterium]
MPARSELEPLYRQTNYHISLPERLLILHVDDLHPLLDEWLRTEFHSCYAFITACNPGSRRLSETENATRMDQLRATIRAASYLVIPGEGVLGDWREASYLVPGVELDLALGWARQFGQAAILWGRPGGTPGLHWTEEAADEAP